MNEKIYVHDGWGFVCYQYRGILYCNALPAFSLRDARVMLSILKSRAEYSGA